MEITQELPKSNSHLTTPQQEHQYLPATSRLGQTITINSSPIEDADNFEGWTPTYEYSWEVTSDNGSSWIELTSADATDGDDSYTLTSESVGKQLRGVVSYLDGYGTNEILESDASLVTPVIRGDNLYSLLYKDHPKYENPWLGELGEATNPALSWYSWGNANQESYRKELFGKAKALGGDIAVLKNEDIYDLWMESYFNEVSFSAYIRLENNELVANLRKNVTGYGSEIPCTMPGRVKTLNKRIRPRICYFSNTVCPSW